MLTQPQRRRLIAKLDALCRECVMLMARGECAVCGNQATDPHHIITRKVLKYRWNLYNILAVCRICHTKLHNMTKAEQEAIISDLPAHWSFYQQADRKCSGTYPTSRMRDQEETLTKIRDTLKGAK